MPRIYSFTENPANRKGSGRTPGRRRSGVRSRRRARGKPLEDKNTSGAYDWFDEREPIGSSIKYIEQLEDNNPERAARILAMLNRVNWAARFTAVSAFTEGIGTVAYFYMTLMAIFPEKDLDADWDPMIAAGAIAVLFSGIALRSGYCLYLQETEALFLHPKGAFIGNEATPAWQLTLAGAIAILNMGVNLVLGVYGLYAVLNQWVESEALLSLLLPLALLSLPSQLSMSYEFTQNWLCNTSNFMEDFRKCSKNGEFWRYMISAWVMLGFSGMALYDELAEICENGEFLAAFVLFFYTLTESSFYFEQLNEKRKSAIATQKQQTSVAFSPSHRFTQIGSALGELATAGYGFCETFQIEWDAIFTTWDNNALMLLGLFVGYCTYQAAYLMIEGREKSSYGDQIKGFAGSLRSDKLVNISYQGPLIFSHQKEYNAHKEKLIPKMTLSK